jgi:hypothetical protein
MLKNALVIASLALAAPALAEEGAPAPSKQAKDIQCLVGTWNATGKATMGDQVIPVKGTYACRSAAGGFGVMCHLELSGLPAGPYVMDDVWGYNAGDGLIHWYTVTSYGETHDHRGHLDGNTLVAQYDGPQDGKLYSEKVTMAFTSKSKFTVRSEVTVGGTSAEIFEMTATKSKK